MPEEDSSNNESSGQHFVSKTEESLGEFSPLLASKPQDESSGQSTKLEDVKPPKMFKSKREVVILIALSLMVFAATCCESVLAPFFTPEVRQFYTYDGCSSFILPGTLYLICEVIILSEPILLLNLNFVKNKLV